MTSWAIDRVRRASWLPRFYWSFLRYELSGARGSKDGSLLVEAFCQTEGRALTRALGFAKMLPSRWRKSLKRQEADFKPNPRGDSIINWQSGFPREPYGQLRENGWTLTRHALSPAVVKNIVKACTAAECEVDGDGVPAGEVFAYPRLGEPIAERYIVPNSVLLEIPEVQALATDPGLLQLVGSYLDAIPILDAVNAWFTFPSKAPSSRAAQLFHFDLDRVSWVKVFVNLTDISDLNGPHVYIEGTHRDGGIPKALLRRGYTRLSDEDVEKHLPTSKRIVGLGEAGDLLIEDTRGLHKGSVVQEGFRLLLQLEYTSSLFGAPLVSPLKHPEHQSPEWREARIQHPHLFSAFEMADQ